MNPCSFEKPVSILVGLGFPRQVESVMEAHQLLTEWPPFGRSSAHTVALKACEAALRGEIDTETARGTFIHFARRNNLLISDEHDMAPAITRAAAARVPPN